MDILEWWWNLPKHTLNLNTPVITHFLVRPAKHAIFSNWLWLHLVGAALHSPLEKPEWLLLPEENVVDHHAKCHSGVRTIFMYLTLTPATLSMSKVIATFPNRLTNSRNFWHTLQRSIKFVQLSHLIANFSCRCNCNWIATTLYNHLVMPYKPWQKLSPLANPKRAQHAKDNFVMTQWWPFYILHSLLSPTTFLRSFCSHWSPL